MLFRSAVALVALAGLTVAVVILATDDEVSTSGGSASGPSATTPQLQRGSAYADAISALTPEQLGAAFGTNSVAPGVRYDGGPEEGSADVTPAQPRVTQQAFPGLAGQAEAAGAQSDSSSSQSGTKDYSLNGATGDFSNEPEAQSGSRADGADENPPMGGPGARPH